MSNHPSWSEWDKTVANALNEYKSLKNWKTKQNDEYYSPIERNINF